MRSPSTSKRTCPTLCCWTELAGLARFAARVHARRWILAPAGLFIFVALILAIGPVRLCVNHALRLCNSEGIPYGWVTDQDMLARPETTLYYPASQLLDRTVTGYDENGLGGGGGGGRGRGRGGGPAVER